jgi:hypothetical protein
MAPMERPEYVRMNLSDFPDEIIEEYKLRDLADKNVRWWQNAKDVSMDYRKRAS